MGSCDRCADFKVRFNRAYDPHEFIEGDPSSPIWIVGLNPHAPENWDDRRSPSDLNHSFAELVRDKSSYFRKFEQVSHWLFKALGTPNGVAHTDLVKCSSPTWPPPSCQRRHVERVIENCGEYLLQQIRRHRPRLIVANGAEVCGFLIRAIPPTEKIDQMTSYRGRLDDLELSIVLSGFIGRIDNYARRRLGAEIERIARELELLA